MNFDGLPPSHKHSWILCWAITFKGWRHSKSEHREISASLSQTIKKGQRSVVSTWQGCEGFYHSLSSSVPVESFLCAEKAKQQNPSQAWLLSSLWVVTDDNSCCKRWGVSLNSSTSFSSPPLYPEVLVMKTERC